MPITKATASSIAPAAKGDLVVGSATNDAAVLGVGSNDQVLTADSSTATGLKWATPAAGGMTLISTTTLSGASTTISSIPQTYNNLQLNIFRVTDTSSWGLNIFPNNASLATDEFSNRGSTGTMSFRQDDYIRLTGTTAGQANNQDNGWTLTIYNYTSTTAFKPFTIVGDYYNNGKFVVMTSGVIRDTSALTSLVFPNAFTAGTVQLYGVK